MATIPSSSVWTDSLVIIVVSRSVAETVSSLPFIENKKLSKIGKVLLVLRTPDMLCKCLNKVALEAIKFMPILFCTKITMQVI